MFAYLYESSFNASTKIACLFSFPHAVAAATHVHKAAGGVH